MKSAATSITAADRLLISIANVGSGPVPFVTSKPPLVALETDVISPVVGVVHSTIPPDETANT